MSNLVEIDPDIPGIQIFKNRKTMGGVGFYFLCENI